MKLRDLVANSLPRVRGRKKKSTTAPVADTCATLPTPEVPSIRSSNVDKGQTRMLTTSSRGVPRDGGIEGQGITEASWRGNALYRSLEAQRGVEISARMMTSSYTSSHGIVTSHSAEGFSSQLMMMSRSYDSRMAVSDYNGSCSQMSSISETGVEPWASQQQYYHCHYHRHNHHHHHHHHIHTKPMGTLIQNQQELSVKPRGVGYSRSFKGEETVKSEPGFFKKSFASFRSMRKHSSRSNKDSGTKQAGTEPMRCSVCPYPETNMTSVERKSSDKRPAKPKRKGLKGFSRSKENKESYSSDKCDKSWFSDNDAQSVVGPMSGRTDPTFSNYTTYERPRVRECSVDSCSSRLYGSREGSCPREIDLSGFDSASLSGYESDLPRGKVHRSRSRIKTNPWLPSPQPSLSGGRRGENCDLRESKEELMIAMEDQGLRIPRSASFEHQRNVSMSLQTSSFNDNAAVQRHRSLTPSDVKMTHSLDRATKSPPVVKKVPWWTLNRQHIDRSTRDVIPPVAAGGSDVVKGTASPSAPTTTLNDLSANAPKSRPTSIVSPNSEFVMLADNIEQLANNISFEYEDMLDSTLESVSVSQEDGQLSLTELLTDEENGNGVKRTDTSDSGINNAHSPDSGIGGLGSTDGDDALTPNASSESKGVSIQCSTPNRRFDNLSNKDLSLSGRVSDVKSVLDETGVVLKSGELSVPLNLTTRETQRKPSLKTQSSFDEDSSATVSESDIDNTSYNDNTSLSKLGVCNSSLCHKKGSPLPKCKTETKSNLKASTLMVEERLDIQFQPPHRHFPGNGVIMGSRVSAAGSEGLAGETPSRWSDPTDSRKISRPCALKTNPTAQYGFRVMNNIEKCSEKNDNGRPWSDEFDLARNITLLDCVESPTENWQCDGHFSMCSSQDTVILENCFERVENKVNVEENKQEDERSSLGFEELVVKLDDNDISSISQNTTEMLSENTSLMDCSVDKLDTDSHDYSFEMSDACVQTDFDDDFSRWDDVETLESLEENAIDPAESTRIWLLTGNMQGSADTGYSSQTRDSQILMDEDTLFLAGELEERAASERLSYGERSGRCKSEESTPRNSTCIDSDSKIALPSCRKSGCLSQETLIVSNTVSDKVSMSDGNGACAMSNISSSRKDGQVVLRDPQARHKQRGARSIPHATVNEMFLNIETQFQEIFQQIYDHENMKVVPTANRNSSDSSDSTIKFSRSADAKSDEKQIKKLQNKQSYFKDSETGEIKEGVTSKSSICGNANREKDLFADHDYVNVPSSKSRKQKKLIEPLIQPGDVLNDNDRDANGNVITRKPSLDKSRHAGINCEPSSLIKRDTKTSKDALTGSKMSCNADTADYLEFLKDTPLNRSHLKRPFFLVPGVGPVDMSCSEQVNIFSDSSQLNKAIQPYGHSVAMASPSMSPSLMHCGKKLKFKKGHPKVPEGKKQQPEPSHYTGAPSCRSHVNQQLHSHKEKPSTSKHNSEKPNSRPTKLDFKTRSSTDKMSDSSHHPHHHHRSKVTSHQHTGLLNQASPVPPLSQKEIAEIDHVTRNLAERVLSLRREKDIVYKKIQEAQQDEASRQEQRKQLQRNIHTHRKEALLETLHELRDRLEEQSRRLNQKGSTNGGAGAPPKGQ